MFRQDFPAKRTSRTGVLREGFGILQVFHGVSMDHFSLRLRKVQSMRCFLFTKPKKQVSGRNHSQQHLAIFSARNSIFLQLFFEAVVHIRQPNPAIPSFQSQNRMVACIACRIVKHARRNRFGSNALNLIDYKL